MMKKIALLGSTGSIGTQTLNVVRRHPDRFAIEVLCAGSNTKLLEQQAREFMPNAIAIADESRYADLRDALADTDIKVFAGEEAICSLMEMQSIDIVLSAIVGVAGLKPTLRALEQGKAIALANKETMVVAGELVTALATRHHAPILPVDSEHSAIFQSLVGEVSPVEKILLTASGGPFRGKHRDELQHATLGQALHHPNWNMGRKVTIDSASLMNKGLEVIEAKWLFGVAAEQIEVVVHPQSVVHSAVQFADGSIKAQLGIPSMETPIQYALSFPEHISSPLPRLDLPQMGSLTFEQPDRSTFRCLDLAYRAIARGGNIPCAMNAADEVAVQRFIAGKIGFLDIADCIERAMDDTPFIAHPTLDDLLQTDQNIRTR